MTAASLSPETNSRRRWFWLLAIIVLLLTLVIAAFRFRSTTNQTPLGFAAALPVFASASSSSISPFTEVKRGEITKLLLLDGELRAVRSRTIFVNMSEEAKITFLPPEGSVIKAGDRLVELDSTAVLNRIKDAEERIVAAENEIVRTSSQHESQIRDLEVELSRLWLEYEKARVEARVPAEVLARRDYQDRMFALEKTKAEYENQLAKIAQKKKEFAAELQVKTIEKQKSEVELNKAKNNLNGMMVKAPADGMVIYSEHWDERRKVQIGDVIWGGFPVLRLPDMTEMELIAQVNEVDGPKISVGNSTRVRLDSYPDKEITGTVKEISQTAAKAGWNSKSKVFTVIVSLDQTITEIMKPGMSAQVSIIVGQSGAQLLVPRSAVRFDSTQAIVTRLEARKEAGANNQRAVAVTIVAADPFHYAIASGGALKEGDQILTQVPQ